MNAVIHRFNLDLHSSQSQISIPVMQFDTNRAFQFTLSEGGKPYFIEDGCIAALTVKHPTGTTLVRDCVIRNNSTIEYDCRNDSPEKGYTAAVLGVNPCEITLCTIDGDIVASPRFSLVVHDRATPAKLDLPDADKVQLDAILEAEQTRNEAEEERYHAENAREANESIRQTNEANRTALWNERVQDIEEAKENASKAIKDATEAITLAKTKVSNALVAHKSGTLIEVNDASPLQDSLSVKVRSKNLLPFPYKSDVFHGHGMDLVVNEDGTLIGRTTEDYDGSIASLVCDITEPFTIEESGIYTFHDGYDLPGVFEAFLIVEGTGEKLYNSTYKLEKGTKVRLAVEIYASSPDGLIFSPQLEKGAVATAYTSPVVLSDVKVISRGKNFLPSSYFASGVHTEKGVTFTFYEDGSFLINGTVVDSTGRNFDKEPFSPKFTLPAGTYFFSSNKTGNMIDNNSDTNPAWRFSVYGGGKIYYTDGATFTLTQPAELNARLVLYNGCTFENVLVRPLLELSSTKVSTGFEPYRTPEEYAVNSDGTVEGIAIHPTNLLTTDADGALIECNYNRDINKAYEELCNAIISLGGNV